MTNQLSDNQAAAEWLMQKLKQSIDSAKKLGWISEEEALRRLEEEITDKLQEAELEAKETDTRYSAADVLQSVRAGLSDQRAVY